MAVSTHVDQALPSPLSDLRVACSWIFILEGLMTILAGVLAYFIMVDRPVSPKTSLALKHRANSLHTVQEQAGSWLTPEEKAYVIWRKESDGSSVGEAKHISWK